jgi:crossover junction endodeoxyribonuclease RuvC
MSSAIICGVDPGKTGAIAFLDARGQIIAIHDMPVIEVVVDKTKRKRISAHGVSDVLKGLDIEMVVIEQVGGITGQSASAAFTFGHSCGLIQGVVIGLNLPVALLPPQRWKKAAHLPADKGAARLRAQQLWPEEAKQFARIKDDGRAEACLIARHYWNETRRVAA